MHLFVRLTIVLLAMLAAAPAAWVAPAGAADCYNWPLRRGEGNRIAEDADSIYVSLPGLPKKLAAVTVQVRGISAPRTLNGHCLDEKKKGVAARGFALKLLGTADKVGFCDPEWQGETNRVLAGVTIDGHDYAQALIAKGHARAVVPGKAASWCGK